MSGPEKKRRGRAPRVRSALAAVLLATACAPAPTAGGAEIAMSDFRIGAHPDYTRLAIDLSGRVEFRLFALTKPYRLAIDFPELEFAVADGRPSAGGAIAGVRYGRFRAGTSRMVLDLARPAQVARAFFIPPGADGGATRLVIDLADSDADDFAAFAQESQRAALPAPPPTGPPVEPPSVPPAPRGLRTVVIDPGHGGIDPGAIGGSGIHEKEVALEAARHMAERFRATGRYRVVMTREDDVFVRLRDRVALARAAGADLFLSVHADSLADSRVRGSHVYTLSKEASDDEAEALADKENQSDVIAGVDLAVYSDDVDEILLDLSQRATNCYSARLADMTVAEFARRGVPSIGRPHRRAGFAVLKAPDVPSLLIEFGFLSNREDEERLRSREGREPTVGAIVDAVDRYFDSLEELCK